MLNLVILNYSVTLLLLIFIRMTGCVVFSSIFGRINIPMVIRVGLTLMLSPFSYQLAPVRTMVLPSFLIFFVAILHELLLGFLIGFIIQMSLSVILISGENMDIQIGISISKTYNPRSNVSMPISGPFISAVFFLLFSTIGVHRTLIQVPVQPCVMVLYREFAIDQQIFFHLVELFRLILVYVVKMSLPIMASQLITGFAVGLIMEAAPRLNIFMIDIQIKVPLDFGILFLMAGSLTSSLERMIDLMLDQIGGVHRMPMQRGAIPTDSESGAKGGMIVPGSSKTEKATPEKREDERKKGNIFQSTDIVNALSLLVTFMTLRATLPYSYEFTWQFLAHYFSYTSSMDRMTQAMVVGIAKDCAIATFSLVEPIIPASTAAMIIGTGIQTKLKFSKEKIKFRFSSTSLLQGLKCIFSPRFVVELSKSIIRIAIILYLLYTSLLSISNDFTELMFADAYQGALFILCNTINIVLELCVAFTVIPAPDYLCQWREYERNIRMSEQDLKEEYRQMKGDPFVKNQQRERRRKVSMQRVMQQVPMTDVIVRNPTHLATAPRYDIEKDVVPVVVAKGQGYSVLRITKIAEKHRIPMTENKPLAQALYREVEVDRPISAEYYVVLAEIMAWVYSMRRGSADIKGSK